MRIVQIPVEVAGALMLALLIPACAPVSSPSTVSRSPRSTLVLQLEQARELDKSNAMDPHIGPIASGDYSVQADKAETAIFKIEQGAEVSHKELADALFVPPKSLSEAQRDDLIHRLRHARQLDDRGWRDWTRDAAIAQDFTVQEKKADWVISGLERGEPVSWLDINDALSVPAYP
jgi:hypothetical protein